MVRILHVLVWYIKVGQIWQWSICSLCRGDLHVTKQQISYLNYVDKTKNHRIYVADSLEMLEREYIRGPHPLDIHLFFTCIQCSLNVVWYWGNEELVLFILDFVILLYPASKELLKSLTAWSVWQKVGGWTKNYWCFTRNACFNI